MNILLEPKEAPKFISAQNGIPLFYLSIFDMRLYLYHLGIISAIILSSKLTMYRIISGEKIQDFRAYLTGKIKNVYLFSIFKIEVQDNSEEI